MVEDYRDQILTALKQDLNRHAFESTGFDLRALRVDLLKTINNLEEWTADEYPDAGFIFGTMGRARIHKEPLGVTLIIGAWNYPLCILLQPLVAAIAAGCCAILKPSELAPATQNVIVEIIPKYLDQDAIRVVTAGPVEMGFILSHKFNHIFYTGSSKIARIVSVAAAKHLTPVTLELGGQGPAVLTSSADVDLSAKRIASSKIQNAGQICLAVNHVFVPPQLHDDFIERISYWFDTFTGGGKDNSDLARIVNDRNFDRLERVLSKTEGKIVYGGQMNRKDRYIQPTVVTGVSTSGKCPCVFSDIRSFDARGAFRTDITCYKGRSLPGYFHNSKVLSNLKRAQIIVWKTHWRYMFLAATTIPVKQLSIIPCLVALLSTTYSCTLLSQTRRLAVWASLVLGIIMGNMVYLPSVTFELLFHFLRGSIALWNGVTLHTTWLMSRSLGSGNQGSGEEKQLMIKRSNLSLVQRYCGKRCPS
jgi:hypothetical protein